MKQAKKPRAKKTPKGEQTRTVIENAALELIRERGYEQTTMRAIAEKAHVSLGNAYHYFPSKDHLVQAFYHRIHEEHLAAALPALEKETTLKGRLHAVIRLKVDILEPYHQFAAVLFKTAAHPESPLNPFADESAPVRRRDIELFEAVSAGSKGRIPEDLRAELPYLLWVFHMGIILFWIHDNSKKQVRTYRLVDRTVDLVSQFVSFASNPLIRPVRRKALRLLFELKDFGDEEEID
jgi:AcrR family transcriptional regulator